MIANIFIYTGLFTMLLGSLYGIYVGYRGKRSKNNILNDDHTGDFKIGNVSPEMKRLITIWRVIMLIGFVLVGIGIAIG